MTLWIVVGFVAVLFVLFVIRANARVIRIAKPTVGFLNLLGESGAPFLHEDRDAIRAFFYDARESQDVAPKCDVLLIYATVLADGSILGTPSTLRQIVSESGAKIVILATDNLTDDYMAALKSEGGKANIVLTLDRRSWRFSHFIEQLFSAMQKGPSMPVVWVRLAPQNPNDPHQDCPATVFLCELGQVAFKGPSPFFNR
jgi:hypothetical protein